MSATTVSFTSQQVWLATLHVLPHLYVRVRQAYPQDRAPNAATLNINAFKVGAGACSASHQPKPSPLLVHIYFSNYTVSSVTLQQVWLATPAIIRICTSGAAGVPAEWRPECSGTA
jgi:hypothetical protein